MLGDEEEEESLLEDEEDVQELTLSKIAKAPLPSMSVRGNF